jgi:uncharacterized protein YecE (DUF72 family)
MGCAGYLGHPFAKSIVSHERMSQEVHVETTPPTMKTAFSEELSSQHTVFKEWAAQLAQWLSEGKSLYMFCHCPFEVHSPEICWQLYQHVRDLVSLPPLPWQKEDNSAVAEQPRLF